MKVWRKNQIRVSSTICTCLEASSPEYYDCKMSYTLGVCPMSEMHVYLHGPSSGFLFQLIILGITVALRKRLRGTPVSFYSQG